MAPKPKPARPGALVAPKREKSLVIAPMADAFTPREEAKRLRFVTDEDVPDAVGRFLSAFGCEVHLAREVFAEGCPDRLLVEGCDAMGATVITLNKRDFVKIIGRRPPGGNHQRYRRVGAIYFECPEPMAARRLEQLMDLVVFEFVRAERHDDKRVFMTIDERQIQIER